MISPGSSGTVRAGRAGSRAVPLIVPPPPHTECSGPVGWCPCRPLADRYGRQQRGRVVPSSRVGRRTDQIGRRDPGPAQQRGQRRHGQRPGHPVGRDEEPVARPQPYGGSCGQAEPGIRRSGSACRRAGAGPPSRAARRRPRRAAPRGCAPRSAGAAGRVRSSQQDESPRWASRRRRPVTRAAVSVVPGRSGTGIPSVASRRTRGVRRRDRRGQVRRRGSGSDDRHRSRPPGRVRRRRTRPASPCRRPGQRPRPSASAGGENGGRRPARRRRPGRPAGGGGGGPCGGRRRSARPAPRRGRRGRRPRRRPPATVPPIPSATASSSPDGPVTATQRSSLAGRLRPVRLATVTSTPATLSRVREGAQRG